MRLLLLRRTDPRLAAEVGAQRLGDLDGAVRLADAIDDAGVVSQVVLTWRYADAVRQDEQQAREYQIGGVPFFVIDGRLGVGGAQPAAALVSALQQAASS